MEEQGGNPGEPAFRGKYSLLILLAPLPSTQHSLVLSNPAVPAFFLLPHVVPSVWNVPPSL